MTKTRIQGRTAAQWVANYNRIRYHEPCCYAHYECSCSKAEGGPCHNEMLNIVEAEAEAGTKTEAAQMKRGTKAMRKPAPETAPKTETKDAEGGHAMDTAIIDNIRHEMGLRITSSKAAIDAFVERLKEDAYHALRWRADATYHAARIQLFTELLSDLDRATSEPTVDEFMHQLDLIVMRAAIDPPRDEPERMLARVAGELLSDVRVEVRCLARAAAKKEAAHG